LLTIGFNEESIHSFHFPLRQQRLGTAAALCAQTGVLSAATGHIVEAAFLTLTSSLAWAWLFSGHQGFSPSQTRRTLLVSAACVVLTASFLLYMRTSEGFGRFGLRYSHGSFHTPQPGHHSNGRELPNGGSAEASDSYVGILLWPEKQKHTRLVAPVPVSFKPLLFGNKSNPLVIPFDGVYWVYKAPDNRPPATSRDAHGSPEMFSIRSIDRRPLRMDAHQNLGTLINLNCCSRIEIAIRNADRYPESVSLELVLTDSSSPEKRSQSFGRAMVRSTRPWRLYDDRPPTTETLSFVVPANAEIRRFDEITVVFRLDADRSDAGAKIGIDHFTLLPRGL
jgi:hypothetical protein